jgi:hypothetical protein
MPTGQQHIIRRQVLRVDLRGTEAGALALQRRLSELCQGRVLLVLDRMLERTVPADEHWMFERLDVDAGAIDLDDLERGLADALSSAMEKRLRERAPAGSRLPAGATRRASDSRRSDSDSVHEAFLHFLKTGSLPWWFHLPAGKTLEQVVLASWRTARESPAEPTYFTRTIVDAIASVAAQKRLVRQFSPEFLEIVLTMLSPQGASALGEVLTTLGTLDIASGSIGTFSRQLWQVAFAGVAAGRSFTAAALVAECRRSLLHAEPHLSAPFERLERHWPGPPNAAGARGSAEAPAPLFHRQPGTPEAVAAARESADPAASSFHTRAGESLRRDAHDHDAHPEIRAPGEGGTQRAAEQAARSEAIERIDMKEGAYIGSAGLVLLHPFLPRYFEALGIAAEDRLLQPERALCLLHFLATGQRVAPEHELLLPKLLCNLPFEAPAELSIELTAAEEEESAALLDAVVRHWDALGGTSADGLRGTLLARAGKLSERADGDYLLQVEAQSFDILLDHLPWSVSIVKLPWMERQLWVEWR